LILNQRRAERVETDCGGIGIEEIRPSIFSM
jgi:hypothetical protein